jgi:hypothetical protein
MCIVILPSGMYTGRYSHLFELSHPIDTPNNKMAMTMFLFIDESMGRCLVDEG